jgi:D-tyrosyl-tRNA(Tyr) deacylase
MRAVVQRVQSSSVIADGQCIAQINRGMNILLGVFEGDTAEDLDYLVKKIIGLRIFDDKEGKMNLSIQQVNGEILVVSQFTLCADTKKGNRPSFISAAHPDIALKMYEVLIEKFKANGLKKVVCGQFGAHMQVQIMNDGPVTILLDSKSR